MWPHARQVFPSSAMQASHALTSSPAELSLETPGPMRHDLVLQLLSVAGYSLARKNGPMAITMLCMHTSRSLKGSTLRQNGHLKSATAAVAETSAPLWVNLAQKLRSSAGSRRRWEQRRVHSGHRRRRQQAVHMSMSLLHPYISQQVSRSGAASWLWLGQLLSAGACAPGIGSAEGCGASVVCVGQFGVERPSAVSPGGPRAACFITSETQGENFDV